MRQLTWDRPPCGEITNAQGKVYEGECACGCDASAHCLRRNCPHSEVCRRTAGVDEYRVDGFVWVRQSFKVSDEAPRPAQIMYPLKETDTSTIWQYYICYVDDKGGKDTAHLNQLRRMHPLETLACQA